MQVTSDFHVKKPAPSIEVFLFFLTKWNVQAAQQFPFSYKVTVARDFGLE